MLNGSSILRRTALLSLVVVILSCGVAGSARQDARQPIGPGQFYPRSASTLKAALQAMLADAVKPRPERPIAIIVPHAGYLYSGQIAADAYRQAAPHRYDTIVIVGTNHTSAELRGVAIVPGRTFRTPLGAAPIDEALVSALMKEDSDCALDAGPHRAEHSVEVQVPFVQHLFPDAKIVPMVVGRPDRDVCVRLGRALAKVIKGRSVLIVGSSDLSHYPSARDAARVDRQTMETITRMDVEEFYQNEFGDRGPSVRELATRACGSAPIMAVMTAAAALGANRGTALSYANSADVVAGDPDRVVGYGAVVFTAGDRGADLAAIAASSSENGKADAGPLQAQDRKMLLALARDTIRRYLATETLPLLRGFPPRVAAVNRGVFVTLKKDGELRGCIGHIPSDMPLLRLVSAMAFEAAFNDPRFPKVALSEMRDIDIEISILSPPKPVNGPSEIVVGRDGVFLTADKKGAVFLPQVPTEQGWNRDQMLDNLCIKAGLPANRWRRPGVSYSTFQADVFGERNVK